MHILREKSLLFTNNNGAPDEDILGRMKFLSSKSCNYCISSFSSVSAIRYRGIDIGNL